jgi:hypothetical protein
MAQLPKLGRIQVSGRLEHVLTIELAPNMALEKPFGAEFFSTAI